MRGRVRTKFFSFQNMNIRLDTIKSFSFGCEYWICVHGRRIREYMSFTGKPTEPLEKMEADAKVSYSELLRLQCKVPASLEYYSSVPELKAEGIDAELRSFLMLNVNTFQDDNYQFTDYDSPDTIPQAYSKLLEYLS